MSEAALSRLALYTARPTLRINGESDDRAGGLLIGMDMIEQEDGLSSAEVRFSNVAADRRGGADLAFEDETSFKIGDRLAIYTGEEAEPTEIFSGLISGIEAEFSTEGSPTLTALAEDTLQKARMKRRTRTHNDQTLADLARSIAQDLGLTPRITGFADPIGTQVQFNESDLGFLRKLLARYDGDLQVVGSELHVSPRSQVERNPLELHLRSQLRSARILADLAHQINEVTVAGWDPIRGESLLGRSTGSNRGPGRGRTGADLLPDSWGRRHHHLSHLAVATANEADAVAEAAFDERQRRFVTVHATAEGNPLLRVGTHVTLTGLGARFSNTYYVTRCRHRFDLNTGYETDFTGECAFLAEP